jgi:non-homologous end joining protein Ku
MDNARDVGSASDRRRPPAIDTVQASTGERLRAVSVVSTPFWPRHTELEWLISELSETEFQPDKYEDEYRKRLLKAIEQKIAGQEIQRAEVETRPPTTDVVATLEASLGRKELAKISPGKSKREPMSEKRPVRPKRAS